LSNRIFGLGRWRHIEKRTAARVIKKHEPSEWMVMEKPENVARNADKTAAAVLL